MTAITKFFVLSFSLYAIFMIFYYGRLVKINRSVAVEPPENFLSEVQDYYEEEPNSQNLRISSSAAETDSEVKDRDEIFVNGNQDYDSVADVPTDDDYDLSDDLDQVQVDQLTDQDISDEDDDLAVSEMRDQQNNQDIEETLAKELEQEKLRNMNPFAVLGAYPEVTSFYAREFRHDKPKFGIYRDDDYCDNVDAYNLKHPENIFKRKTFYTNFPVETHVPGSLMSRLGNITVGNLDANETKNELTGRKVHLPHNINAFIVSAANLYYNYEIGKHFACATQIFNHIPGQFKFVSKDSILDLVDDYTEKFATRPQCFEKDSVFPKSYRLYDEGDCNEFFSIMHSNEYQDSLKDQPIQYLIKVSRGSHQSTGVFLLDKEQEGFLDGDYKRGKDCGKVDFPLIAQTYIANPLLLDKNNKFDFRIYMLIASTNPFIAYYHDGFLRLALDSFDKNSNDKSTHLTNTHLAIEKMIEARDSNKTINDMTEQQMQDAIWWPLENLGAYLYESGKVTDPNWLNNYLRPAFKKSLIHLVRMSKDTLWPQSNVFELYGVDFMLDDNLNLWFIESNPNPQLTGFTQSKNQLYLSVVMGTIDIQFAYYKSRMTRVLDVVKRMQAERETNAVVDYDKWRKEYQEATKNRLEPKYKINSKNNFVPIIDENLPGAQAYFGLIDDECVII